MSLTRASLLLVFLSVMAPAAMAWGEPGHRVVAELAARQLRPAARDEVAKLLAGEPDPTLAGVANWADELRASGTSDARRSRPWHFLNFKGGNCEYVPARDCPDGDCIVAAINGNFLALADRSRADAQRRDALKFLVHFIGDVHQPLHATAIDDHGGGDFQIAYHGKGRNLHGVWDSLILRSTGLSPEATADELFRRRPLPTDPTGRSDRPAVDWAVESCQLAKTIYPTSHVIADSYLRANLPVVEERLRRAGSRLADMLNYALDPIQARPSP